MSPRISHTLSLPFQDKPDLIMNFMIFDLWFWFFDFLWFSSFFSWFLTVQLRTRVFSFNVSVFSRSHLTGFARKEFRGKLAIAITANFINRHTQQDARVEEISGVAFIFNQQFFQDLKKDTGIDLENIVYYKDETHYFVMTAKKQSLLQKGVILEVRIFFGILFALLTCFSLSTEFSVLYPFLSVSNVVVGYKNIWNILFVPPLFFISSATILPPLNFYFLFYQNVTIRSQIFFLNNFSSNQNSFSHCRISDPPLKQESYLKKDDEIWNQVWEYLTVIWKQLSNYTFICSPPLKFSSPIVLVTK